MYSRLRTNNADYFDTAVVMNFQRASLSRLFQQFHASTFEHEVGVDGGWTTSSLITKSQSEFEFLAGGFCQCALH